MASPTSPPVPTLRRLQWPSIAPVDLATEFPWLILYDRAADEWPFPVHTSTLDEHVNTTSVYAQPLKALQSPPPARSPAQRAARKMLRLQDELERQEEIARRRDASAKAKEKELGNAVSPGRRAIEKVRPLPSPKKMKKPWRPVEATTSHAKLQEWIARQRPTDPQPLEYSAEMEVRMYAKMHATLGNGLWNDEVASPIAAELSSESVFGGHVATRRLAFVPHSSPEKPQQIDPEAAASSSPEDNSKHTDDPEPSPIVVLEKPLSPRSPIVIMKKPQSPRVSVLKCFADDVREEARALVASGDIAEALATLQDGINRVLHDFQDNDEALQRDGFDYSSLAHAMAQRLQRTYKTRHRHRVASLVRLQRVWRRVRIHRAYLEKRAWRVTHAAVIQCAYKKRFLRRLRERSAIRLQRFFRVFLSQKLLIWLHRACRLLTTDYREKREIAKAKRRKQRRLWTRLVTVLAILRLITQRRRAVVRVQSQWRGYCARRQYTQQLTHIAAQEAQRSDREVVFVADRLARAREALRVFYSDTPQGKALVEWRLRAPWLRWRRLRSGKDKNAMRPQALATTLRAMFAQRDGTNDIVLKGFEGRCVSGLLGLRPPPRELQLSEVVTGDLWTGENSRVHTPDLGDQRPHIRRLAMWTRKWTKLQMRAVPAALWTLATYPKLVLATSGLFQARRRRARVAAVMELLDAHDRVLRVQLRRMFHATENDLPKYECVWCGSGIATAREFYAHRNAAGTGCVERERRAQQERAGLAADVAYHNRWRELFRRRQNRSVPAVAVPVTFSADAPFVQHVAARGCWNKNRNRKALQCLVDVAQCCAPITAGSAAAVPAELLAQLVWLLDNAGGHPLERIHAVVYCDTRPKPNKYISTDEAMDALDLGERPQRPPRASVWTRAWQQLRVKFSRRGSMSLRYGANLHRDRSTGNRPISQRILARVVALG